MIRIVKVTVKAKTRQTVLYNENMKPIKKRLKSDSHIVGLTCEEYINATVDNATGKIIGWRPITEEDLEDV